MYPHFIIILRVLTLNGRTIIFLFFYFLINNYVLTNIKILRVEILRMKMYVTIITLVDTNIFIRN